MAASSPLTVMSANVVTRTSANIHRDPVAEMAIVSTCEAVMRVIAMMDIC